MGSNEVETVVDQIRIDLVRHVDSKWKEKTTRWHRQAYQWEPLLHGVPTPLIRKLSSKYHSVVKGEAKANVFQLCEKLLSSGYVEERVIAFDWAFRLRRSYEESDFGILEAWLQRYVDGWGACDDLCTHAFGAFMFQFPQRFPSVIHWTESGNRWLRRAAAVVMIYSIRRRKHLDRIFLIADLLLTDSDLMVQKGYGWMLKEASNKYPGEVFNYVTEHKGRMPRTALRYAIEKLPSKFRKEAMKRQDKAKDSGFSELSCSSPLQFAEPLLCLKRRLCLARTLSAHKP